MVRQKRKGREKKNGQRMMRRDWGLNPEPLLQGDAWHLCAAAEGDDKQSHVSWYKSRKTYIGDSSGDLTRAGGAQQGPFCGAGFQLS